MVVPYDKLLRASNSPVAMSVGVDKSFPVSRDCSFLPPGKRSKLTRDIITVNSMLLDITGIIFAVQLVLLITIGPYADYGTWRPWIMISEFGSRQCLSYVQ
jgi:hypothetical protein